MNKDDQSRVVAAAVQAALEAQRMAKGKSKGKGKGKPSRPDQPSFNCSQCGYYNFEWRTWCAACKQPRPQDCKGTGKGGQKAWGGGHGKGGGGGGNTRETNDDRLRILEAENKELREKVNRAEKNDDEDEDDDMELEEDEDAARRKADRGRIQELQTLADALCAKLGDDDPTARQARERVETARKAEREAKPILAQLQAAERRSEKVKKLLESEEEAKEKLQEQLRKHKEEIEEKIKGRTARISELQEESEKLRKEMQALHERARQEKADQEGEDKDAVPAAMDPRPWETLQAQVMAKAGSNQELAEQATQVFTMLTALMGKLQSDATHEHKTEGLATAARNDDPPNTGGGGTAADSVDKPTLAGTDDGRRDEEESDLDNIDIDDGDLDNVLETREGETDSERKKRIAQHLKRQTETEGKRKSEQAEGRCTAEAAELSKRKG